jgi:hypothetical protein
MLFSGIEDEDEGISMELGLADRVEQEMVALGLREKPPQ